MATHLDGNSIGTCAEEEEALLHVERELVDDLPEHVDRRMRAREAVVVLSRLLERLEIEHRRALWWKARDAGKCGRLCP